LEDEMKLISPDKKTTVVAHTSMIDYYKNKGWEEVASQDSEEPKPKSTSKNVAKAKDK
tara:strand:+ start:318 stop:491 length:174 start_codon:yes stop_codon:yes gene_type:complete